MRYTTVIDISEFPAVYKNPNAVRLYIHMALRAGYHDDDRDLLARSVRQLSDDVGITKSAAEHALGVLGRAGLIAKDGTRWRVKKFVLEQKPTPRKQSNTGAAVPGTPTDYDAQAAELEQKARERELLEIEKTRRADEWFRAAGRDELEKALKALETSGSYRRGGMVIGATEKAIEAIKNKLSTL